MSHRDMASVCSIPVSTLKLYEDDKMEPSRIDGMSISQALRFPLDFFYADNLVEVDPDHISFRALRAAPAKSKAAMSSVASFSLEIVRWLEDRYKIPGNDLPDLSEYSPKEAADILRSQWGLGLKAISNLTHLLESKGVRMLSIHEEHRAIDAFSFFVDGTPFILTNIGKSAARNRFDVAHELGHLVMHRGDRLKSPDAEKEADEFASCFLMPAEAVRTFGRPLMSPDSIVVLKKRWNVSAMAMNRRLHDLSIIDEWKYMRNVREMSSRGWNRSEPEDMPRESSMIWDKVLRHMRSLGKGLPDIARDTRLPIDEIKAFVYAMGLMSAEDLVAFSGDRPSGVVKLSMIKGGKR